MLIKIDVDAEMFSKIKHLIDSGRYTDLYQFVTVAISNQIQEEFSQKGFESVPALEETSLLESSVSLTPAVPQPPMSRTDTTYWREQLKLMKLSSSEIEPEQQDLIWSFHNRFLPVKIVIHQLAKTMVKQGTWIELNELHQVAYELAVSVSAMLKEYEQRYDIPRNRRLSTGLPIPSTELKGLRGAKLRKKETKLLSSKERFMDHFVGKMIARIGQNGFSGAPFQMGLMAIKFESNNCFVSLTQNGKEFAIMENPILDGNRHDIAFSDEEATFILKKIISRFKLETIIVNRILTELRKRSLSSQGADKIFEEEKQRCFGKLVGVKKELEQLKKSIVQERVATMSRLSEIGFINWEVDRRGHSTYTLKRTI